MEENFVDQGKHPSTYPADNRLLYFILILIVLIYSAVTWILTSAEKEKKKLLDQIKKK